MKRQIRAFKHNPGFVESLRQSLRRGAGVAAGVRAEDGRDVQLALIGRHHVTERDSAPVQSNGIV